MRGILPLLAMGATLVAMIGCGGSAAPPADEDDRGPRAALTEYAYTGYDEEGVAVVRGHISIAFPQGQSGELSGHWRLEHVGEALPRDEVVARYGPQVGKGGISGRVEEGRMTILLMPWAVDLELYIVVLADEAGWRGQWEYYSDAGLGAHGSAVLEQEKGLGS